jgi:16S rRNA (guanine527-N7)-methyltransferase
MSARPDFALGERRAELDAGMRSLGLNTLNGLEQDPVRWACLLDRLCAYLALLHKWNQVHNLTAIREPAQMVTLHLLDSLALLPRLQQIAITPTRRVLDVGTGGGLPGIPLAIAGPSLMGTSFLSVGLLDSNQKKTAFLQQAVTELELNQSDTEVRVFAERIELHRPAAPYDLILCRAFSSLTEFVQPTRSLLAAGGVLAAMKGVLPQDEIDALPEDVRVYATHQLQVPGIDAERHLILLQPDASLQQPPKTSMRMP